MNERELLYKVLFDMRKDISDLKQRMAQQTQQNAQPQVVSVGTPMVKVGTKTDMPAEEFQQVEEVHDEPDSIVDIEKEAIRRALERFHGNRKATAQALGMGERTLYRKIKEYGM
jgi:DNA-binding NtrC family response regulator